MGSEFFLNFFANIYKLEINIAHKKVPQDGFERIWDMLFYKTKLPFFDTKLSS